MPRKLINTELVEKAQHLFWENGYRSVSPKDLAENLDVSISTIYNKLGKDELFYNSLSTYVSTYPGSCFNMILNSQQGLEDLKELHYQIIDSFLNGTFPKKCFLVNTMVELKVEMLGLQDIYNRYFTDLRHAYNVVLKRSFALGEIKNESKIPEYCEVLVGLVFSINVLCKFMKKDELQSYVDRQFLLFK